MHRRPLRLLAATACSLLIACSLPTLEERPAWTRSDTLPPGTAGSYPKERFLWRGPNATGADRHLSTMLGAAVHRRYGIVPGTFGGSPAVQALRRAIGEEAKAVDELPFSWNVVLRWKYQGTHGETALEWAVLERSAVLVTYTKRAQAVSDQLEDTLSKLSLRSLAPFERERRWLEGLELLFQLDVLRAFCVELGAEVRNPIFRRLSSPLARDFTQRLRAALKTVKPRERDRRQRLSDALAQFAPDAEGRRTFEGAPQAPTAPRYAVPARQKTELDARLERIEAACGPKVRAQAAVILRPDPTATLIDREAMLQRDPTARSRDLEERRAAIFALADLKVGKPEVLSLLTVALREPDLTRSAAQALGWLGPKAAPAVPTMVELLEAKPKAEVRRALLRSLAQTQDPKALEVLQPIVAQAVAQVSTSTSTTRRRGITTLADLGCGLGAAAVPDLVKALSEDGVGWDAAQALAQAGPKGAEALQRALNDERPRVRARAVHGVWLTPKREVGALLPRIADASPKVRHAALKALPLVAVKPTEDVASKVLPTLQKLLSSKHEADLSGAAVVLGWLGAAAAPAVPGLTAVLDHPKPYVWLEAAQALAEIGEPAASAAPKLLALLVRDPEEGYPVVRPLGKLYAHLQPPQQERTLNLIAPLLKAKEAVAAKRAIDAFVAIGLPGVPRLLEVANRKSEAVARSRAQTALGRLAAKLPRDQLQTVIPVLLEAEGEARAAAGAGLSQVVVAVEPDLFAKEKPTRQLALRLLLQIGPLSYRAVPSLRTLLNDDPDPGIRAQAAAVLSAIGLEAGPAVDDLENASQRDPDAAVKAAAKNAFERVDRAVKAFEKSR